MKQIQYPITINSDSFEEFCDNYFDQFGLEHSVKYTGPKYDGHTHVWNVKQAKKGMEFSKQFNISKVLAIVDENLMPKLDDLFPDTFYFARFLRSKTLYQKDLMEKYVNSLLKEIDLVVENGENKIKVTSIYFGGGSEETGDLCQPGNILVSP